MDSSDDNLKTRIPNALIAFLRTLVSTFLLLYAFYCIKSGWYWAMDIADTYFLLIIRVIVVFLLSILSIFTVITEYGEQLITYGKYCLYIAIVWGIITLIINPSKY